MHGIMPRGLRQVLKQFRQLVTEQLIRFAVSAALETAGQLHIAPGKSDCIAPVAECYAEKPLPQFSHWTPLRLNLQQQEASLE